LLRYSDLTVFKLAAVRYLGFLEVGNFTMQYADTVGRVSMRQRTKLRADRSNRCGDMAVFRSFKMATI